MTFPVSGEPKIKGELIVTQGFSPGKKTGPRKKLQGLTI